MSQAATITLKGEGLPSKEKPSRKALIGLAVVFLLAGAYCYIQFLRPLTHPRVPVATTGNVAPASTPSAPARTVSPSPGSSASELAAVSGGQGGPASLGDSIMAVLSPSAKAETIQSEMQPGKTTQSMAAPAARQVLRTQPTQQELANLIDQQKLLLVAQARFGDVIDMASKNPDIFGFEPNERMDDATLGAPIRVYTIKESDRKSYQLGQSVKPILTPTDEWVFPAMLNNRVRFMVPVRRVNGEYEAETSSRALAMVYEKIRQRWPASQGYHPQLVVYPNIVDYYFTIPELPDQNLTDTSVMFEFNPTLSPASVILASWQ